MNVTVAPPFSAGSPLNVDVPDADGYLVTNLGDVVAYVRAVGATSEGPYTKVVREQSVRILHTETIISLDVYPAPSVISVTGGRVNYRSAKLGLEPTTATQSEISEVSVSSDGGYEFTGGFTDRTTGQSGASDVGTNVQYTQAMVDDERWLRFGFDAASQLNNDFAYWTDPTPAPTAGVGLFGGSYMPAGVDALFDYSFDDVTGYSAASEGSTKYTAATGSYDFSQCRPGDLALVRFDFNCLPQVANTTVEVGLIWATRDSNDNITFTFALAGEPVFFGTGTVGRTFLNRPIISAYFASNEDVNARALPAIRADNVVQIQPLTTLCTIVR